MAKVITFSRTFPAYHPKAGRKTYFVEKIWKGLYDAEPTIYIPFDGYWQRYEQHFPLNFDENENIHTHHPKHHTIRSGKRWKAGDVFSPRVWTGKPYCSPQIAIAPDMKIEKVWNIGLRVRGDFKEFYCEDTDLTQTSIADLAQNDGLTVEDLFSWFDNPFEGQIICWNKDIQY